MKLLHTADWHLGKRLGLKERTDDHMAFFDWLLKTIALKKIDVLIIAGDVFDTGNPSNTALKLYYDFLWRVMRTSCSNVIVIGGNHDSVGTLHAPKDLLMHFNVHVVGGALDDISKQLIPISGESGKVEMLVCAVPFLRDSDIKLSISGETVQEREARIRSGIENHYRQLIPLCMPYKQQGVPLVATGHLFMAGASTTPDSEKEIHVGNLGQIGADRFPSEFDYVALGHLHRPQLVNGNKHVRYSGSPIPLSFSENEDIKKVILADFYDGKLQSVDEVTVPTFCKMVRIKGSLEQIISKLLQLTNNNDKIKTWLEIQVETKSAIYDLEERINLIIKEHKHIEIIFIKQQHITSYKSIESEMENIISLHDLSPKEVFAKKCATEFPDQDCTNLQQTFAEALELMSQSVMDRE